MGTLLLLLLLMLLGGGGAMLWRHRKRIPLLAPPDAADRGRVDRMSRTREMMAVWISFQGARSPGKGGGERRRKSIRLPSNDEDDMVEEGADSASRSADDGEWF